ncbi:hypothetical protein ACFLZV_06555 [Candidatus Margulisiibacteriota bacterium]
MRCFKQSFPRNLYKMLPYRSEVDAAGFYGISKDISRIVQEEDRYRLNMIAREKGKYFGDFLQELLRYKKLYIRSGCLAQETKLYTRIMKGIRKNKNIEKKDKIILLLHYLDLYIRGDCYKKEKDIFKQVISILKLAFPREKTGIEKLFFKSPKEDYLSAITDYTRSGLVLHWF